MGDGLTIFTIPHTFNGLAIAWQSNAIKSWTLLDPPPAEIMLFGNEPGTVEVARKFGCSHKSVQTEKKYGVPLVNSAFARAQKDARSRLMAFINTDVIFTHDLMPAIETVAAKFPEFLMIGRKIDLDFRERLRFNADWQDRIRALVKKKGTLHGYAGLDYFVFTKGLYKEIPPFVIGRRAWDNWLAWHIIKREIPVVDATQTVMAIHQQRVIPKESWQQKDLIRLNRKLAGKAGRWGRTNYASWGLTKDGELRERK